MARRVLLLTGRRGGAMIAGLITSKDVLPHTWPIVQGFGIRCYLHCLRAVISRRRTTFLELLWPDQGARLDHGQQAVNPLIAPR